MLGIKDFSESYSVILEQVLDKKIMGIEARGKSTPFESIELVFHLESTEKEWIEFGIKFVSQNDDQIFPILAVRLMPGHLAPKGIINNTEKIIAPDGRESFGGSIFEIEEYGEAALGDVLSEVWFMNNNRISIDFGCINQQEHYLFGNLILTGTMAFFYHRCDGQWLPNKEIDGVLDMSETLN
jgi:hypothetical protein